MSDKKTKEELLREYLNNEFPDLEEIDYNNEDVLDEDIIYEVVIDATDFYKMNIFNKLKNNKWSIN